MNNFFRIIIVLVITLCFGAKNAHATHLMGAEITYKQLDSLRFRIDLVFYRDCRGIPFGNPTSETKLRCGSTTYNVTLSLVKIEKMITGNDTFCLPKNTYATGGGIEKHYYSGVINFGDSYYKSAYSCGAKLIIESGQCCRQGGITTGLANTNFYNFAELNLNTSKQKNNSPDFINDPTVFLCCNNPTYMTFAARDTIDGDSLSYHFAYPKENYTTNVTYSGGYDYNKPFSAYYPGSFKFPNNNPNAKPPIGIYLDSKTGDMVFTPVKCDEVSVVVIEVKEWRVDKDSMNIHALIGAIRRDIMQIGRTCSSKNPVIEPSTSEYFMCEDSTLCIDFTSRDHTSSDSIKISVESNAPGATISHKSSGLVDTVRFCFTLKKSHLSELPFQILVTANNNGKPYYGFATKTIAIKTDSFYSKTNIVRQGCNTFKINSQFDNTLSSPVVSWSVYNDQMKKVNDSAIAYFMRSGKSESFNISDTVLFKSNGKFYLVQSFQSSKAACLSTLIDSVIIENVDLIAKPNITDTTGCVGDSILILDPIHDKKNYKFTWSNLNDPAWKSTDTILYVYLKEGNKSEKFTLRIEDLKGCSADTTISISSHPSQPFKFNSGYQTCEGDTIQITTGPQYHSFLWSNGVVGNTGKSWKSEQINVLYKDSFNCEYQDSISTIIFDKPVLDLPDVTSCDSVQIKVGNYYAIVWSDSSKSTFLTTSESGTYWVWVKDYFNCESSDTFQVLIHDLPVIKLGADTIVCSDSITFQLQPDLALQWNTGATASTIRVATSRLYILNGTDANACKASDSIYITKLNPPSAPVLTNKGDSVFSNTIGLHRWYRNDTLIAIGPQNFIVMTLAGNYTARISDTNQCESALSNTITFKAASVESLLNGIFEIYPNPSTGALIIAGKSEYLSNIEEIRLSDIRGSKVDCKVQKHSSGLILEWMPISGILMLQIHLKSGETIHRKIAVQ